MLATTAVGVAAAGAPVVVQAATVVLRKVKVIGQELNILATALEESTAVFSGVAIPDEEYVPRKGIEAELASYLTKPTKASEPGYGILVGARGVGKTTVMDRVTKGMLSVVVVNVGETDDEKTIVVSLLKAAGCVSDSPDVALIEAALQLERKLKHVPVKIIFDVNRGSKMISDMLSVVSRLAKTFAVRANVLIVVSEANAALGFTNDPGRQDYFFLDDMTDDEAKEYLKKQGQELKDPKDFDYLKNNVGLQALMLANFCKARRGGQTVKDFCDEKIADASAALDKFTLWPILAALQANPQGVHTSMFRGKKYEGINLADPVAVFIAMKGTDAVLYHKPSRQYHPISRAVAKALEKFPVPPFVYDGASNSNSSNNNGSSSATASSTK